MFFYKKTKSKAVTEKVSVAVCFEINSGEINLMGNQLSCSFFLRRADDLFKQISTKRSAENEGNEGPVKKVRGEESR